MGRLRRALPILLILALPPVMLHTLWLDPVSAGEDDLGYYYPLRVMVGAALREGRWPINNPLEATGAPLLADPQSAVMHPATWLFAVIDSPPAYALSIFAAFWLAGGGAWLYLRKIALARPAAMFGTVAFMFCGFMVGHRVHLGIILAAAMLPWGLWCVERLRRREWRALFWIVPCVYLALAAGHWPTFIHMCLIWAAYFALRARPLGPALGIWLCAAALALLIALPQIAATFDAVRQTARTRIGYATAGENSFFPAAAMLAGFPFIFGSRTPNFFPQTWWGPWHLCEMLGYVGLATLVLAGAAVWRLYRKRPDRPAHEGRLVRVWTWIAIGAGVWMLGYYTPLYRLVHMLPILGMLRCPARMVLAVDMALATLAAIAIHALMTGASQPEAQQRRPIAIGRLSRSILRGVTWVLPAVMMVSLLLLALVALLTRGIWTKGNPFFVGGADEALLAVNPANPAVWVPLALMAATAVVVRMWLARPAVRAPALVALLLIDLFFITRFVDVQAEVKKVDLGPPPAAAWVKQHAGEAPFRVWGLSGSYHHRQRELLLPKTCCAYGVATIANYGPFQSSAHVHLLGFNICGYNRDWARLLRRNHMLSLYGVRYFVVESGSEFQDVLESVEATAEPERLIGENLLGGQWELTRAERRGAVVSLRTSFMWRPSEAQRPLRLAPNAFYRISLDARGPRGGAANFLRADVFHRSPDGAWYQPADWGLSVPAEQVATGWRHFEWTFRTGANVPTPLGFRLLTMSERPIEVRGVSMRRASGWETPWTLGPIAPGTKIYRKLAELPPIRPGEAPVAIYENRLALPRAPIRYKHVLTDDEVERLKWSFPAGDWPDGLWVPNLGLAPTAVTTRNLCLATLLPGVGIYLVVLMIAGIRAAMRATREAPSDF
ncbi:MAG TPA: hypothetical protein VNA25_25175 [Phycisphaerae bacterium]|nr:hypothetical protein [Phycisphaerae bacterium]HUT61154.1 hypothetical protein [Phycisphaerae bacterium]